MVIKRTIQPRIEEKLFKGKVIIIYGARRVGKTTLVKELLKKYSSESAYFNCDEPDIRMALTDKTSTELISFIGNHKLVILDEAQRVKNIGLTLKLMVDTNPQIQIIATGSSSFDLSNNIVEPLTGRKYEFFLYPFSLSEIKSIYSNIELKRLIENRVIYGMYPEVLGSIGKEKEMLEEISRSYLYKDIFQYQQLKNPELLEKLLQALALQIGSEVSFTELSNLLGVDKKTVERYIDLLKKAFVIFTLTPFSRNLRNELTKLRKIYFIDTGIRNALINNFNKLNLRQDTGSLWENFLISERLKKNNNRGIHPNTYFWRTYEGQEIDYIEEESGKLRAFEMKWQKKNKRITKVFQKTYPGNSLQLIDKENFSVFVGI